MEVQRTKLIRTSTMLGADISRTLLRGPVVAQKFGDFGMTTLLGETERRLSIIGLGVQISAIFEQHFHDFEMTVGRSREQRRITRAIAAVRVGAMVQQPVCDLCMAAG